MSKRTKRERGAGWEMVARCPRCGRENSSCACAPSPAEALPIHKQRPKFRMEKRRGKPVTVITHLRLAPEALQDLASRLKRRLGVGGTVQENEIELQGDHREALPSVLRELGLP